MFYGDLSRTERAFLIARLYARTASMRDVRDWSVLWKGRKKKRGRRKEKKETTHRIYTVSTNDTGYFTRTRATSSPWLNNFSWSSRYLVLVIAAAISAGRLSRDKNVLSFVRAFITVVNLAPRNDVYFASTRFYNDNLTLVARGRWLGVSRLFRRLFSPLFRIETKNCTLFPDFSFTYVFLASRRVG